MKGIPMGHVLNHALAHIFNYLDGDRSEDHLGHAVANLCMACHFDENPAVRTTDEYSIIREGGND